MMAPVSSARDSYTGQLIRHRERLHHLASLVPDTSSAKHQEQRSQRPEVCETHLSETGSALEYHPWSMGESGEPWLVFQAIVVRRVRQDLRARALSPNLRYTRPAGVIAVYPREETGPVHRRT